MAKHRPRGKSQSTAKTLVLKWWKPAAMLFAVLGAIMIALNLLKQFVSFIPTPGERQERENGTAGIVSKIKDIVTPDEAQAYNDDSEFLASVLGDKLGTAYSVWDPRRWTEDDEGVVQLIHENRAEYPSIAAAYHRKFKRSLSDDIVNYVDDYSLIQDVL